MIYIYQFGARERLCDSVPMNHVAVTKWLMSQSPKVLWDSEVWGIWVMERRAHDPVHRH